MSYTEVLNRIGDGSSGLSDVLTALRDALYDISGDSLGGGGGSGRLLHQVPKYLSYLNFSAVITGSKKLTGYDARWLYTFKEVVLLNDGTYKVMEDGRSGKAYNMSEMGHAKSDDSSTTSDIVWGVDTQGDSYKSTTMAPRPVGGGGTSTSHQRDVLVEMTIKTALPATSEGGERSETIYTFDRVGSHDGNCSSG